jgi:serine/threonine protein kinase
MDPRVGTEFAGHQIEEVIGSGGASVVYLAEHVQLGRRVALKVLAPHLADDEGFRKRFIRESRTAAALDHPNIVTVYDAGEVEGSLYISMRYVEGSDLRKLLAEERVLEPTRAIAILSQVASALDAAHAEGLVHRDVKPGNILVDVSAGVPGLDRAYLSDFGISKRTTTRGGLTRTGQFVGTVDYVAPEQISGQPVDGRTDVYSLACVLYECLRGEVPFPGVTEVATIYSHLHDEPPSLAGVIDANGGVDEVITRALAKDKADRYDTCSALIEAARSELVAPTRVRTEVPADGSTMPEVNDVATTDVVSLDRERSEDAEIDRHDVETIGRGALDVTPPVSEPRSRPSVARGRRVATISGGTAIAVAITVLALVLPRLGETDDPERPTSTASQSPTTRPGGEEDAPTEPIQLSWTTPHAIVQSELGGSGKQAILDAVVTDDAVYAVGHGLDASGVLDDAAVWRSTDAREWTQTGTRSLAEAGDQRIITATEFGRSIVAAGWDGADASVWVSDDEGRRWTRSTSADLGGSGSQLIRDLVPLGSRLIGIGATGSFGQQDAAAWVSRDGRHWERMTGAFAAPGQQEMWNAQRVGARVVAIGYTKERGTMDAAVWLLSDDAWTRVPATEFDETGTQAMLEVAGGRHGLPLVAVGCHEDGFSRCDTASSSTADAAVWTSSDGGRSWERMVPETGRLEGPGVQVMRAVTLFQGSLVAVGARLGPGSSGDLDGAVWTSVDGVEWRSPGPLDPTISALGGDGDQSLRALVAYGRQRIGLLGFGVTDEGEIEDAQVWTAIVLSR